MKTVGAIPARYASSRLPGKSLVDIHGKPMIWWVWQIANQAQELDEIYVVTDDDRIINTVESFGGKAILTSAECRNASERLSEFAEVVDADIYVALQGDEPLMEPSAIPAVLHVLHSSRDAQVALLKSAYKNPVDVINTTTAKIVCDMANNALLFTRAAIPTPKASLDYSFYHSLGIIAWYREELINYKYLPIGYLERTEDIELLRLLENGRKVKVGDFESRSVAVDTFQDLSRVRDLLSFSKLCTERKRKDGD